MIRLSVLVLALSSASAFAGELTSQGRLLDSLGSPITSSEDLTFRLWDHATLDAPGNELFQEQFSSYNLEDGYYSVSLGSSSPTIDDSWFANDVWLGITVGAGNELPRQKLASVPRAGVASRIVDGSVEIGANASATCPGDTGSLRWASDTLQVCTSTGWKDALANDVYTDSDAVAAVAATGDYVLSANEYTDSDAVAAVAATGDYVLSANEYTDSDARATVASQDIYLRNTGDVMSGNLEITGSLSTNESPIVMYPTMMSFYRAGNGDIIYLAPDGVNYTVVVGAGTSSAGLGASSKVAFVPGNGTTTWGKLYFNLNGVPSYACTLLHNEDDSIRHGFGYATDGGNGYASIWGGSTNTRTFVFEREGVAGVPIGVNQSFRIICF